METEVHLIEQYLPYASEFMYIQIQTNSMVERVSLLEKACHGNERLR
jgi:hypothetical protein